VILAGGWAGGGSGLPSSASCAARRKALGDGMVWTKGGMCVSQCIVPILMVEDERSLRKP
jgi:hypothetical protein